MSFATRSKQGVNAYAKEHQLDALFQKLMDKVLKEMPDDPKEYMMQAMSEAQKTVTEEDTSPTKKVLTSRAVYSSSMPKLSKQKSSAQTNDPQDEQPQNLVSLQPAFQEAEVTRTKSSRSVVKRTESEATASIPARKSLHGVSLEGRSVTFEEPPEAPTTVYIKQSAHPKARGSSPSSAVRQSSSQQTSQSSTTTAPPRSAVQRPRSKEQHLPITETVSVPEYAQLTKSRHGETGIHKIAPMPFIPQKQPTPPPPHVVEEEPVELTVVAGPGRKKKMLMREQKRKHKEELVKFIDSVNSNAADKNGEPTVVEEKSQVESEVEKMLSRCRRNFGVSSYMKSVNNEEEKEEEMEREGVLEENKTKSNRSRRKSKNKNNEVVVYYDQQKNNTGEEEDRQQKPPVIEAPVVVSSEQNEEDFFATRPSTRKTKSKREPPNDFERVDGRHQEPPNDFSRHGKQQEPPNDFTRADDRRQSTRAAWDEPVSTPISPTAAEPPKYEEFPSTGPILVKSTSERQPMSGRLAFGNAHRQDDDDIAELDFGDQQWLQSSTNNAKKTQPVFPAKQQQKEQQQSRRSSASSSISDIFASGSTQRY